MSCGTGECGCGCGELHSIHVRPQPAVKTEAKEHEAEGPKAVLAGDLKQSHGSKG